MLKSWNGKGESNALKQSILPRAKNRAYLESGFVFAYSDVEYRREFYSCIHTISALTASSASLREAGIDRVFTESSLSAAISRPEFGYAMSLICGI